MSGIVNKIKEAVHGDSKTTSTHHSNTAEGAHGPHNSRIANAADPRVDSDRDGSRNMGAATTGRTAGHGEFGSTNPFGTTGTTGHTLGSTGTTGATEGAHGPHSSRLANAADPRVDSDRDGSRNMGAATGTTGTTGTTGFGNSHHNTGIADTTGGLGGTAFGSNTHSHGTGMTGTHGDPAGTHGPHNTRIANAADPRVDSDRDGRGAIGTGPGPAHNTAGPHKSDMLNKLDPRVDSDLDGSNTMGANKTYQ